jgi:predicted 3-demethylubiquinone-9 3-methyltransferase (glyoxalase superfamily)
MTIKTRICLWNDEDAEEAASFYAATFPDTRITDIRRAPGDYPGGKQGDVLVVEFTCMGIPVIGPSSLRARPSHSR